MADFYKILGVPRAATTADIRKAFRSKSKTMHPDAGGDVESFKELEEAARILSDAVERAFYDKTGKKKPPEEMDKRKVEMLNMLTHMAQDVCAGIQSPATQHFVELMREKIVGAAATVADGTKQAGELRKKLEAVKTKIKSKTDENTLAAIVQRQIDLLDSQLERALEMQQAFSDGIQFLEDYDYDLLILIASADLNEALRRQDSGQFDNFFKFGGATQL